MGKDDKTIRPAAVEVQPISQDEERQSPYQSPISPNGQDFTDRSRPTGLSGLILRWTPIIFMGSYFLFSICIYTLLPEEGVKVFWFLYLTIGTLLAGTTVLEAYDGQTLLTNARKAVAKTAKNGWQEDVKLPHVELVVIETPNGGYERIRALRETIVYPEEKLRVTVLSEQGDDTELLHHLCQNQDRQSGPLPEITAIFGAADSPHPHAVRHAVARLTVDKKIDILQSRSVLTWLPGVPAVRAIYSSLTSLLHDASYGLMLPGRTVTWGLPLSQGNAIYARTSVLQNAARSLQGASHRHNGPALGFAALAQNVKAAYDLSVITYTQCPATFRGCCQLQIHAAARWAACVSWLSLVFTKAKHPVETKASMDATAKPPTRTFKQRLCILFTLLLRPLAAHSVLQYFSLALALLFTQAPDSAADFSRLIFFPYPISIWLIISGLVCLAGTVAMTFSAASEFGPPVWSFPFVLILWPFMLLAGAFMDVYGQIGVFLGAF